MDTILNHIGGRWLAAADGRTQEQRNPADLGEVTARFARSGAVDADAAITAAAAAYPAWSAATMRERARVLEAVSARIRADRERIAADLTRENGKTLREALGEVDAAAAEMDWQIGEGLRLAGEIVPSAHPGVLAYTARRPLGVVSVICPWNFPFNVPARKCTPALMAGNTVVMKPASLTPASGAWFARVFADAGAPPGIVNVVTGDGGTVGDAFVRDPRIRAVSFTGSTPVGMGIHRAAADNLAKTQLEMGGKNAVVVLADADLDAAADATVTAAFACAGQWCTSTSRAIVAAPVAAAFERKLIERIAAIRVGDGRNPDTRMGPVCGTAQRDGILAAIAAARAAGARLACGGQQLTADGMDRGCFIAPTVFADVDPASELAREEIFGPVLAVIRADGFEHAVQLSNDVIYGLSSAIYTASLADALRFVERSEVGVAHVNLPTSVKEPQLPFGGVKRSGFGAPEAGKSGIEFFTRHQAAYVRFG